MTNLTYNDTEDTYTCELCTVQRDFKGFTPNGNPMGGRWVLSDVNGEYIDHDKYRHDLFSRHGLKPNYDQD